MNNEPETISQSEESACSICGEIKLPSDRPVALDVETAPDATITPPEPTPPANYRDPSKIDAWLQQAVAEQRDRQALCPFHGRILTASFAWFLRVDDAVLTLQDRSKPVTYSLFADHDDDADVTARILSRISSVQQLVTFNGAAFDIPYVIIRAMLHNIPVANAALPSINHYACASPDSSHADVYQMLQGMNIDRGRSNPLKIHHTLHFYAKRLLGLEPPYDHEKGHLGDVWGAGRHADVAAVSAWDAAVTLMLFEKARDYYPPN